MTEKLYTNLATQYKFSSLTFKVLYTGLATVCQYSSGKLERMSRPALFRTLRTSFNVETDYIFQQNATGKSSMSMTISHDAAKRSTVALVFGARQDEANAFIDILLSRGRTPHWSALPLAALELTADDFSNQIKLKHNDVWKAGNSLQMDTWATDQDKFDVKNLDLIGAIRSLNSLFVELAYYSQACQTSQSLLGDIEKMVSVYSDAQSLRSNMPVTENIQHLKSWYDGIQARSDYLTRRAEALLQTVSTPYSHRGQSLFWTRRSIA